MNCQDILNQGSGKMVMKDISPLINNIKIVLEKHKISTGAYSRYIYGEKAHEVNEYGCADASNILYTIGEFPKEPEERKIWVEVLRNMQDKESGLFYEETHFSLHTTAHCVAAIELFDALPKYKLKALDCYKTKEGLYNLLESLEWKDSPWNNSHKGAGIFAALNIAGEATDEWNKWYFEWLWNECDPNTGLWRKDFVDINNPDIYKDMAGSFHYLFNHEYARMPLRYPEKMIDTCLYMYEKKYLNENFGRETNFIEVDWVYCITRALRQCNHRYEECIKIMKDFSDGYLEFLLSLNPETSMEYDDLHLLFGTVCCIAELQQFLPGYIHTEKPLKLVLDRRPFI